MQFKLHSDYVPKGDQPEAIKSIVQKIKDKERNIVLMGATGTGKTFTIANVIQQVQKPTFVICHNKTLAGQLHAEFKVFFPKNKVEYFVSNFDFYQPEAYIPRTDTYIDKTVKANEEINMMRLSAMNSLVTRKDTIVVCSVAAIYSAYDPRKYKKSFFEIRKNMKIERKKLFHELVKRGYQRNDFNSLPGTFKVRGDALEISPSWTPDHYIRISIFDNAIEDIARINISTKEVIRKYNFFTLFPATDYISEKRNIKRVVDSIKFELKEHLEYLNKRNQLLEAQRLEQRTNYDCEAFSEFGSVNGVENYSRHFDNRKSGEKPFTLIDYFGDDFLAVIDESHMTIPQTHAMYNTDRSRKKTLVEHGFRLPSALDNRPLNFDEFYGKLKEIVYVSATPGDYELEKTNGEVVEQIIRPTGLIDPNIIIKPSKHQIDEIISQLKMAVKANERVFITTLTIRTSEELTDYLKNYGFKVAYLHSELKTLERLHVLTDLRKGKYDCIVGINLLREGLDLPEVALIMIIDADKEGFLRNTRSLIQTVGRAARNVNGRVILFADKMTKSIQQTIDETNRRKEIQEKYNRDHNITPQTIIKKIHDPIEGFKEKEVFENYLLTHKFKSINEKIKIVRKLRKQMLQAAKDLDFEYAAELRDVITEMEFK